MSRISDRSRRWFLGCCVAGMAAPLQQHTHASEELPPVSAITCGPKHHWFGYYDKLQIHPSGRYVLGMEVDFEHRSPEPTDEIRIGWVDLADQNRWVDLGSSTAWGWQQGCMLQWIPGSDRLVIWNDRQNGQYISYILNTVTGIQRKLPSAIYALSPDGAWAVTTDFRRLDSVRPGYGYSGIADPNADVMTPDNEGLWKVDLDTGEKTLLYSIAQAAAVPNRNSDTSDLKHYFNHLLVSPDGSRVSFLHRWRYPQGSGRSFGTRLFTIGSDGSNPYVLDPYGETSHFIWRSPKEILAWAWHPSHGNKFYLYRDQTTQAEVIAPEVMPLNGHCTYLPGNDWILNDTYPDKESLQHPYLYEVVTGTRVALGHFYSPPEYRGEWRCDNHPRYSPDGTKVVIDSPHGGEGRQMYLIDIANIVSRTG